MLYIGDDYEAIQEIPAGAHSNPSVRPLKFYPTTPRSLSAFCALSRYARLIAEETGGSIGVRDETLLESALEGIHATFDGQKLYPAKFELTT